MKTNDKCDKCSGKIINGKCPCGFWYEHDKAPNFAKTLERAIYAYDYMCEKNNDDSPFTGDHYSGNCIALFKGNYEDTQKVKNFIKSLRKI